MTRPKVPEDRVERLEEIVDKETELPASALTFADQLEYLLDVYETRGDRLDFLGDRVDKLERELEEARDDTGPSSTSGGRSSGSFGR